MTCQGTREARGAPRPGVVSTFAIDTPLRCRAPPRGRARGRSSLVWTGACRRAASSPRGRRPHRRCPRQQGTGARGGGHRGSPHAGWRGGAAWPRTGRPLALARRRCRRQQQRHAGPSSTPSQLARSRPRHGAGVAASASSRRRRTTSGAALEGPPQLRAHRTRGGRAAGGGGGRRRPSAWQHTPRGAPTCVNSQSVTSSRRPSCGVPPPGLGAAAGANERRRRIPRGNDGYPSLLDATNHGAAGERAGAGGVRSPHQMTPALSPRSNPQCPSPPQPPTLPSSPHPPALPRHYRIDARFGLSPQPSAPTPPSRQRAPLTPRGCCYSAPPARAWC